MKIYTKSTLMMRLQRICSLWKNLVTVTILCLFVLGTAFYGSTNRYSDHLIRSLNGTIAFDDPELLLYIKNEILQEPSTLPYALQGGYHPDKGVVLSSEVFGKNVTDLYFKNKRGGVFIEAGALDGESMSVTLPLEVNMGWTGLLVESDPVNYAQLEKKHRKAWRAPVCLSPYSYPSKELFTVATNYDANPLRRTGIKGRAMNGLAKYALDAIARKSFFRRVQCIPLESLLMALNMTHIDLFVLDVEGAEMAILDHLDFNRFIIDIILLEWKEIADHPIVAKKLESRGYRLTNRVLEDLVLVRKGSKYDPGESFKLSPTRYLNKTQRSIVENQLRDKFKRIDFH